MPHNHSRPTCIGNGPQAYKDSGLLKTPIKRTVSASSSSGDLDRDEDIFYDRTRPRLTTVN